MRRLRIHPDLAASGFMLAGVVLRLREWGSNRSLWRDEAMLALNVISRDLAGLTDPLDYNQMAPPGFLWAVKGIVLLLGPSERSLRAFACLAGIGTLVAVWWLARTLFGRWPAVLATAAAALSPALIYYSGELKPYSSDALCSAALLALALGLRNPVTSVGPFTALAVVGSIAIWLSYAAPFTLAALGASLALDGRTRGWRGILRLAPVGAIWLVNWLAVYSLAARSDVATFMRGYWSEHFLWLRTPHEWAKAASVLFGLPALPFSLQETSGTAPRSPLRLCLPSSSWALFISVGTDGLPRRSRSPAEPSPWLRPPCVNGIHSNHGFYCSSCRRFSHWGVEGSQCLERGSHRGLQ